MVELHERLKGIEIPEKMRDLPIDKRGFPVPWFVDWINGEPEFRAFDIVKKYKAVNQDLCWVCGKPFTSRRRYFAIGPMCVVNQNTSEPPCHLECAEFSCRGCPFLSMPKMVRRTGGMEGAVIADGHLPRNPGVIAIYETRTFRPYSFRLDSMDFLIALGEPESIDWWAEGRPATREEVEKSLSEGLHALRAACDMETDPELVQEAVKRLDEAYTETLRWAGGL